MPQGSRISRSIFAGAAVCALAMSGCAATTVPSHHLHGAQFAKAMDGQVLLAGERFGMDGCVSCEDRQRFQDYAHHAAPYVAGPFMHPRRGHGLAAQQATIQPPHSKFHPVPTRPVFEPHEAYLPPQPMGVQLVPVPDQGFPSMMPHAYQPEPVLNPPRVIPEPTGISESSEAETFILSPPSN